MIFPPWLEAESRRLASLLERGQFPHALLIHGPTGIGRRMLAARLVELLLGDTGRMADFTPLHAEWNDDEEPASAHPDFRHIRPLEDKKTIQIDQIRELIEFLSMTSHQGGAKAVVITPAQAMTPAAANCLLKTLEEPTPGSYLILIAESLSRLPGTVISRCQRIRIAQPDRAAACRWLDDIDPGTNWAELLELGSGAPLVALGLHRSGFIQLAEELATDLAALRRGTQTPAGVAKRWAKKDPEHCLRWLFYRLGAQIRTELKSRDEESSENPQHHRLQKSTKMLNMEPAFAVLLRIGEMRHSLGGGFNMELHLADVLTSWYRGGQAKNGRS